ncbi:MAG: hypothetical protein ACR2K9_01260 [Solirubrobacteraceae bacterium]
MREEQPEDPYGQPGNPLDGPAPEDGQAEVGEATGEGGDSDEGAEPSGDRGRS